MTQLRLLVTSNLTSHITICDSEKKRDSYSSGFYPNASHSGKASAETVRHDISKMTILSGNDYEDMKGFIDFFMNDRSGDGNIMLDELEIEEDKRLKCNAHIILATDVAVDKVFRNTEVLLGISKLISECAGHVFSSPKNYIWYLGLTALAKLLSPSHNTESISLHE